MATLYRTLTGQSQRSHHSTDGGSVSRPAISRITTTDPWSGVLNHLTGPQLEKLDDFKAQLQKAGWWTPVGLNGKPSHDDGTLLFVSTSLDMSEHTDMTVGVIFVPESSTSQARSASSQIRRNG